MEVLVGNHRFFLDSQLGFHQSTSTLELLQSSRFSLCLCIFQESQPYLSDRGDFLVRKKKIPPCLAKKKRHFKWLKSLKDQVDQQNLESKKQTRNNVFRSNSKVSEIYIYIYSSKSGILSISYYIKPFSNKNMVKRCFTPFHILSIR